MALTPLPIAPTRADPGSFDARAEATLAAQVVMVQEINDLLPTIDQAASMGTAAATAAANAAASAAAAASSADLAAAVAGGSTGDLPSIRPTLLLDFANSRTVDPRVTFSRLSSATRVNERGLIESVPAGVPRIDHDPVSLACKGLLIEGPRTNHLLRSREFDHAAWAKVDVTVTPNTTIAPDGTLSADTMTGNAGTAVKFVAQTVASTALQWSLSVYLRPGTEPTALLYGMNQGDAANCRALVDFAAGTITPTAGPGVSGVSARLRPAFGGWWRASLSWTFSSAPTSVTGRFWLGGYSTTDSTGTMHLWHGQLESGAAPSSPIETAATALTRAADNAAITGAAFSAWYRQAEGTFVADAVFGEGVGAGEFPTVFRVNDGSANNRMGMVGLLSGFGPLVYASGVSGGVTQFDLNSASSKYQVAAGGAFSRALAYRADDVAVSGDGQAVDVDVLAALPVAVDQLALGSHLGAVHWNGHIRRLAYYPARLLNENLRALSAP